MRESQSRPQHPVPRADIGQGPGPEELLSAVCLVVLRRRGNAGFAAMEVSVDECGTS